MPAPAPVPVLQEKMAEVQVASDEKKVAMGGMPSMQVFHEAAIIRQTGAGFATASPLARDLASLSTSVLAQKYGPRAVENFARGMSLASSDYSTQASAQRPSLGDAISDTAKGVGLGAVNGIGGLGAIGLGLINSEAGMQAAAGLQKLNDLVQGSESPELQARREAVNDLTSLNVRDSQAQREQDKKDGYSPIMSDLRYAGRNALSAIKNTVSDGLLLTDNTAQAAGSLLTSAPTGKVLGAIGRTILPTATRGGILAAASVDKSFGVPLLKSAPRLATSISEALPSDMMVGVGLQEAGGAYQGSASDIASMDPKDLAQKSPYYRELIQQGVDPEVAKAKVANRAGMLAAAVAGPAGMISSHLTEGFEKAPFASHGLAEIGKNLVKETTEEGIQGATGQLGQNLGEKIYADPNKDLLEGVGEQVGLGALGGLASAGVVQAPNALGHTVSAVAKPVIGAVANSLNANVAATQAQNAAASPVSDANIAQAGAQAATQAPETASVLDDAVTQAQTKSPEAGQAMQALAGKILDLNQVKPEEVQASPLPDPVKAQVAQSGNRVEFMQHLADVVNQPKADIETRAKAALSLYSQYKQFDTLTQSDQSALEAIPETHQANDVVEQFNKLGSNVIQNPKIAQALALAAKVTKDQANKIIQPVSETADFQTPEVQQNIANAATMATLDPANSNLDANESILAMAGKGKVNLTQDQFQALQSSIAIMRSAKDAADKQAEMGHRTPLQDVSNDILTKPGYQSDGKNSAVAYAKRIFDAMRAGNQDAAQGEMTKLGQFVQHMNNKAEAVNAHYDQGQGTKAVPFQALNAKSRGFFQGQAPQVHAMQPGSVELAQRTNLEADRLSNIYNGLSKAFPALKASEAQAPALHPNLQGKVSEVVQGHRDLSRVRPLPGAKVQEKPNAPVSGSDTPATEKVSAPEKVQEAPTRDETPQEVTPEVKPETKAEATPGEEPSSASEKVSDQGAEAKELPKTTKEAYPNLYGSEDGPVKTHFHRAYKLIQGASRLVGQPDPVKALKAALKSSEAHQGFTGETRNGDLSESTSKAYRDYLDVVPKIREQLEKRLAEKLAHKNEKGQNPDVLGELFAKGSPLNEWREGKALNLVEQQEDGSFAYNKPLLDQAIIAGLQWLLVSDNYRSDMDEGLVSKLTGMKENDVTSSDVKALDVGLSPVEAVRSLSSKILNFWGVKKNSDVSGSYTDGIANAVAGEVLMAMTETPVRLLKLQRFYVDPELGVQPLAQGQETKARKVIRLVLDETKEERDSRKKGQDPLFNDPTLLEETVLKEPEDKLYYGGDKVPLAKSQLHNPLVELTKPQVSMIKASQGVEHFVNTVQFGLYQALGEDGLVSLFGGGDTENRPLNKQDKLSIDGLNRTVIDAWRHLNARIKGMKGREQGLNTPIHYAFNVSSVGRLQMLGSQNPQASKLVREVVLPTWSTLNLGPGANDASDQQGFSKAIAQALGIKIYALDDATIFDRLHALVEGPLAPSLELLGNHLENGVLPKNLVEQLKADFAAAKDAGVALTPNALHALTELARWRNSSDEDKSQFKTGLYIEADGVTNGIVNAINIFTSSDFSTDQVTNMAKGGRLFGEAAKTMNEYRASDGVDLYTVSAGKTESNLNTLYRRVDALDRTGGQVKTQLNHVLNLMQTLLPDVRVLRDDKGLPLSIEIKRGVTKNPMTITLYGAGAKGIAGNITNALMEAFYEKLSEVAQAREKNPEISHGKAFFGEVEGAEARFDDLADSLNALLTQEASFKEGSYSLGSSGLSPRTSLDPVNFEFNKAEFKALQQNLLHLFVEPMRDAITETVGQSLMDSASLVQQATQAQSVVLEHLFKSRVKELMKTLGKEFPSEDQLNAIRQDLLKVSPLINTGEQRFFPIKENNSDFGGALGTDFTGTLESPAEVHAPADVGVKALAMLNLGMGDGYTIQQAINSGVKGLPTFDGFHLSVKDAQKGSEKLNEGAFKSWNNNPQKAVFGSYGTFLANMSAKLIEDTPGLRDALTKALGLKKGTSAETLMDMVRFLGAQLEENARIVDQRHQVMNEHQSYTDQMAAVGSSHLNKGKVLSGSHQEIAGALQARLNEVQGKTSIQEPAKVMTSKEIIQQGKETKFTSEQRQVWDMLVKAKALDGYKVVSGTFAQIQAHRIQNGLKVIEESHASDKGFIEIQNKTIYLVHGSAETMLHEAIHAATFSTLSAYYNGENLGPHAALIKDAVKRLEGLMDQFTKLEPFDKPEKFYRAVQVIGNSPTKAAALNEFMAWVLANKSLTIMTQGIKANPLVQMAKDIWAGIKRMIFGRANLLKFGEDLHSQLLFNAAIVIQTQPTIADVSRETTLSHNVGYGQDDRLQGLSQKFDQVFGRFLNTTDKPELARRVKGISTSTLLAGQLADLAQAQGFHMTNQAKDLFHQVVQALALSMKLNPNSLLIMDQLYRHVTKNLTPEMLMDDDIIDEQQRYGAAKSKFDMLLGHAGTFDDTEKRSSLLPVFMGLALVDDGLREVLHKTRTPEEREKQRRHARCDHRERRNRSDGPARCQDGGPRQRQEHPGGDRHADPERRGWRDRKRALDAGDGESAQHDGQLGERFRSRFDRESLRRTLG
jgi:hypothetical protein